MTGPVYVVITPVRNEIAHIAETVGSVVAQTIRPTRWVIVDDGSRDGTAEFLDDLAAEHEWITIVHRPDRGFRKPGGGVVEALHDGYRLVAQDKWDYIVKLDADLSFAADYFERCFYAFDQDPLLGIAGGTVCIDSPSGMRVESQSDPAFHVRGATKIYRQQCWFDVQPLVAVPGWDTVDEVMANMRGWSTRTIGNIRLRQHKATGRADGQWRNWFKNGRGCYLSGYHPLFMLGKCVKRAFGRPLLLPGVALAVGFCSECLFGQSPIPEVARYMRRQQLQRLMGRPSIYG